MERKAPHRAMETFSILHPVSCEVVHDLRECPKQSYGHVLAMVLIAISHPTVPGTVQGAYALEFTLFLHAVRQGWSLAF